MKKLILSLMVLATLASCGKKNTTDTGAAAGGLSSTSPITVTGSTETQLASLIDNNQFGSGQASYYETWNQVVSNMPNLSYKYGAVSSSQPNCNTVAYIFQICTSSSSTSNISVSRSVIHSSVDLNAKKNELKAIINARQYVQVSGTSFYIRTNDNRSIIIDTRYPLQANPVSIQQSNGTGEVFLRAE